MLRYIILYGSYWIFSMSYKHSSLAAKIENRRKSMFDRIKSRIPTTCIALYFVVKQDQVSVKV